MKDLPDIGKLEFPSYADILKQNSSKGYVRSFDCNLDDLNDEDVQELKKKCKYQNVVFDISVLNYPRDCFLSHLALISNPMIRIYEGLINELDKVNCKDSTYTDYQKGYAKSLLKFVASDRESKYSIADTSQPESSRELVKYAKKHKAIIITDNVLTICFAKLYKVQYRILKQIIENPFDSESDLICGIDASVISNSVYDLQLLFSTFRGICICDVTLYELEKVNYGDFTLEERESAEFVLASIAYFGNVKQSTTRLDNADKSIVNFYKENQVNLIMGGKFKAVLTADSGFASYSRCENVPYVLCLQDMNLTSDFIDFMENKFDFNAHIINNEFYFKSIANAVNESYIEINTYRLLLNRVIIHVFSSNQILKEVFESVVRIYPEDVVVLRNAENIIVLRFVNAKEAKARIWYTGSVEKLPEKYKKFLV